MSERAKQLAEKILAGYQEIFEDGQAEQDEVRMLTVGLSAHRDQLTLRVSEEYESYPYSSGDVLHTIVLPDLLDEIDSIEREHAGKDGKGAAIPGTKVRLPQSPAAEEAIAAVLQSFRDDLQQALRIVAAGDLFEPEQAVAVRESGLNKEEYSHVVSFCHPQGDQMLYPLHEHVRDDLVYPWGLITDEGLVVIYPEGEGDSLEMDDEDEDSPQPVVREHLWEDLLMIQIGGRGVKIRRKDELFEREFKGNHSQDSEQPERDVTMERLKEFANQRPDLLFDPYRMPEGEAKQGWLALYRDAKLDTGLGVVNNLDEDDRLDEVPEFLEILEDKNRGIAGYAEKLIDRGRFEEGLKQAGLLKGAMRLRVGDREMLALLALERYDDVLACYERCVKEDENKKGYYAAYPAMAFAAQGKTDQARALLDPLLNPESKDKCYKYECEYAYAYILRQSDPQKAKDYLLRSLDNDRCDPANQGEIHFKDAPELLDIVKRRSVFKTQGQQVAAGLDDIRVEAEAAPLELDLEGLRPQTERWRKAEVVEFDRYSPQDLQRVGDHLFLADSQNGMHVFEAGSLKEIEGIGGKDGLSVGTSAYDGKWLVLSQYTGTLHVFDPDSRKPVARAERCLGSNRGHLAAHKGTVALGDSSNIEVFAFDHESPKDFPITGLISKNDNVGSFEDLAIRDGFLLVGCKHGLLIVDIHDPAEPRPVRLVALPEARFSGMLIAGDCAFLCDKRAEQTWVLDIRNQAEPKSVGRLPIQVTAATSKDDRWLLLADEKWVWVADLSDPSSPVLEAAHKLPCEPKEILWDDGRLLLLDSGEIIRAELGPATAEDQDEDEDDDYDDDEEEQAQAVTELDAERLAGWMIEKLSELEDASVGLVLCEPGGPCLYFYTDRPRSLVSLDAGPAGDGKKEWILSLPEEWGFDEEVRIEGPVWHTAVREAYTKLTASDAFSRVASGRVYLAFTHYNQFDVIQTCFDESKEWKPYRTPEPKPPTLEEMLTQGDPSKHREKVLAQAQADPGIRKTVLELASQGHWVPQQIAVSLADDHLEEAMQALSSASRCVVTDRLGPWIDRPDVRGIVERQLESDSGHDRLEAAQLLKLTDDDAVVEIVRMSVEKGNADTADEAFGLLKDRRGELLEDLRAWMKDGRGHSHDVGRFGKLLFEAGETELPERVQEAARKEKSSEQYHSDTFIAQLMGGWDQHPACIAERLWTGRQLARYAEKLCDAGDQETSLWPGDMDPEPHPASWDYVLKSARAQMDDELGKWFEAALIAHAKPDQRYAPDRSMLLREASRYLYGQEGQPAVRFGRAVIEAPEGTFDDETKNRAKRRYTMALMIRGWEVLKARELEEARQIADEILEADPNSGQALFFEARLVWLEKSPEASLEKIPDYLELIAPSDKIGKARLLNLAGCIHDEQGDQKAAIPWFERAAQAQPEEPMYLANLAECYDKLKDENQALKYAKDAIAQGADSEICKAIVGRHKE